MDGMNIIKEYLVSLGFAIDNNKFAQFMNRLRQLDHSIESQTAGMAKNVVKAAAIITTAYTTIIGSTVALVTNTAKADMQYKLFATQMWINQRAAKDFKIALDAMNYSMQDIAWNPELRAQFFQLQGLSRRLQGNQPIDMGNSLKDIRALIFGFKQLQVEIAYASQWISYYLTKFLAGPIEKIRQFFTKLNEKIIVTMPDWTKKVAQFLGTIINIGGSAIRFLKDIYNWFKKIWDGIPKGVKLAIGALLAFYAVLASGPIGQISAAIAGLMLLIEDFYGYLEGRKSSKLLAPLWDAVRGLGDSFNELGKAITTFFNAFSGIKTKEVLNFWEEFRKVLIWVTDSISAIIFLVSKLIASLGYLFSGKWKEAGKSFMEGITGEGWKSSKDYAQQRGYNSFAPSGSNIINNTAGGDTYQININGSNLSQEQLKNAAVDAVKELQKQKDRKTMIYNRQFAGVH